MAKIIKSKKIARRVKKSVKGVKRAKFSCLIISPFGAWFDEYYDMIYAPAISAAGLNPVRADDLYKAGSIINDIWELTKKSKILLADLSGKNPNVFYELGLAHAIAQPVVLVTDNMDDVPFDLRSLRVIAYNKNESDWGNELKKSITKAIKETLSNPTSSILATFVQTAANKTKLSSDKKESLELRQEIETLRNQVVSATRNRQPLLSPNDAKLTLRRYRDENMPKVLAISRVIERGVPLGFATRLADELWRKK